MEQHDNIKEEELWYYCNSLRYGFDEKYDKPIFDDGESQKE